MMELTKTRLQGSLALSRIVLSHWPRLGMITLIGPTGIRRELSGAWGLVRSPLHRATNWDAQRAALWKWDVCRKGLLM
jgi:hypothetical protein